MTPSAETLSEAKTPEPKAEQPSKLDSLRDLLKEQPEKAPQAESAERQKETKPRALKDLAERLSMKDADLYSIEVPMSNGKSMTLGQLKDAAAKQDDVTLRELSFEEDRSRKEGELLRAQNELRELMATLPKTAIKPEVLEAIRQKHEGTMKRERERTLEVIPEWRNEAKRTEEIEGIVEHLKEYGFPANYLQTVVDHRTLRYIRESYMREQRLRRALDMVKQAPSAPATKSKPGAPRKPSTALRSTNGERPRDALARLFSNS
jgi:hypothetical protein